MSGPVCLDGDEGTGEEVGGMIERPPGMRTPRQLLAVLAVALVVIAVQTFRYPPEFLALSWLWCSVAAIAGISCAAAAIRPRRFYIAISGATVVTASSARGIALVIEVLRNTRADASAGLIVGAVTWALVALLAYISWREYVLPWSIGRP